MEIPSSGYAWSNLESKVDTLVKDLMQEEKLPGMTVAVTKNGRLILSKGYGWANISTQTVMEPFMRSRIGSVTKAAVTGPAAWQLMKAKGIKPKQKKLYGPNGLLKNRFEPDILSGSDPNKSWYNQITLQHLLDHAAGFKGGGDTKGAAAMFNTDEASLTYAQVHQHFLRTRKLLFEPGTDSAYSNHGFGLWTLLIEELAGESYRDYTAKRYLHPLGLANYVAPESTKPEARDAWNHTYNQGNPVPIGFKEGGGLGLAAGGFRASAQDLAYIMAHLENIYTEAELDAMGWFKTTRGKYSHSGLREGGTAYAVMFADGYRSLDNYDLSRVHVAVATNIDMNNPGRLDNLTSKIALEVPVANVATDFAINRFLRHDTDIGGSFNEASIDGSVAAFSNSEDNLQIIPYLVNNQGVLTRGEVVTAGTVSQVNIAHPSYDSADAITAFRDADGNLKNIAWDISSSGQVTRRGDATAGPVKRIAVTPFPDGKGVITLTRGNQDDLKLVAWEVTSSLGIIRRGDIDAGAVQDIAVTTTTDDFVGVISATTGKDSKLKLIAWQFNAASKSFSRKGAIEAGVIKGELDIVRARLKGKDIVVTAFRNEDGNLKLITWQVSANGQIHRKDSTTAGFVGLVSFTAAQKGQVVASVKDGEGVLRMIAYQVQSNGQIERVGTDVAGQISHVKSSAIRRGGREFLLTAVRDSENKLRTISWQLD